MTTTTPQWDTESKAAPLRVEDAVLAGLANAQREADRRARDMEVVDAPAPVVVFMHAEAEEWRIIADLYRAHLKENR